ncbi:MAG: universal stress protein [Amphritea sp.]|nr:universal stress protein [Amphritea sp.]
MFKRVLVPIDLAEPDFCKQAINLALREVKDSNAELHLITIVSGFTNALVASYFSEKEHKKKINEIAIKFRELANNVIPNDTKLVLKVYEGSPADSIVDHIRNKGIDLVILSAHNRSAVNEFILGSVSARVAERAKCSVVLLKNTPNEHES